MVDGIYIADHVVLIALGFDETGAKHILGVQEGATENRKSCTALLRDLAERGVDTGRSTLFVIDGAKAMRRAILDVFGTRALVPRCQFYKECNVLEHLPEAKRPALRRVLIDLTGLTHVRTSVNYPQSNGKTERYHRTLDRGTIRAATTDGARATIAARIERRVASCRAADIPPVSLAIGPALAGGIVGAPLVAEVERHSSPLAVTCAITSVMQRLSLAQPRRILAW